MPDHKRPKRPADTKPSGAPGGMHQVPDVQSVFGNEFFKTWMKTESPSSGKSKSKKKPAAPEDKAAGAAGGTLNGISGLLGGLGLDGWSGMTGMAGGLLSGKKSLAESDVAALAGDAVNTAGAIASVTNQTKVADVLGPAGNLVSAYTGFRGALDDSKGTGERVMDGADGVASTSSLVGSLLGPGMGELASMGLAELPALGLGGLAASFGAVAGAGLFGVKTGGALQEVGQSKWGRMSNLGGAGGDKVRTSQDFWVDTGVGMTEGADKLGDGANRAVDCGGRYLGGLVQDRLGVGGELVEDVADVAGDVANGAIDGLGVGAGAATATVMGAFGGIADGVAGGVNYLDSLAMSDEEMEAYQKSTWQYGLMDTLGLVPDELK